MYKLKLLERNVEPTTKNVSIEKEHEWNIEFKNDKQVQDFFKKSTMIQTEGENNNVQMISTEEVETAMKNNEPLTILEARDEYDTTIAFNFYKKEAYPYLLKYVEQNKERK